MAGEEEGDVMLRSGFMAAALGLALAGTAMAAPASPAAPETAVDELTIEADKRARDKIVGEFIGGYVTESPSEQVTRWSENVCPQTSGLPGVLNDMVTARVRQVAATVGAPAKADADCRPNLFIVFAVDPQAVIDNVRRKVPEALGFHYVHDRPRISRVVRPVQAWYATETEDLNGFKELDTSEFGGTRHVLGTRLSQGWRSGLASVIVTVDLKVVGGTDLGSLSDYIAMLSLSQMDSPEACKALPSIANLMSTDCGSERKTAAITESDIAYLKAVYWMSPTKFINGQRGDIAFRMKQILDGR